MRVGHLRQVVPSALEFAFELVAEGTALDGAELRIEEVPAAGRCRDVRSGDRAATASRSRCASCGGLDVEVIGGEELLVESLELEEADGSFRRQEGG